ncbi:hypothetical protein CMQ_3786 [Grosmannia clavigera kw1407]|uniref:Uncharacterized protein n=1 Tax=Grosmannia clavigera (strain kw1407 / UAMH 11150) TaxID=655863 RepID=F0X9T7_GROCL|nr:uncharacterized protein CMQ_3786 [Grosmannia clavigera kw1407]EFX05717.1 hypothetical protein CMQ_3786 [Grosmannia clavigera kw1407]
MVIPGDDRCGFLASNSPGKRPPAVPEAGVAERIVPSSLVGLASRAVQARQMRWSLPNAAVTAHVWPGMEPAGGAVLFVFSLSSRLPLPATW